MTYNVFGGTLSLTQSINQSISFASLHSMQTGTAMSLSLA